MNCTHTHDRIRDALTPAPRPVGRWTLRAFALAVVATCALGVPLVLPYVPAGNSSLPFVPAASARGEDKGGTTTPAKADTPPPAPPRDDTPVVTLPGRVFGAPREWIPVIPKVVNGGKPAWYFPDPGLQEVRGLAELLGGDPAKVTGKVFKADKPGLYRVAVCVARGDVVSHFATCAVIVRDPTPPPPPPPDRPPAPPTNLTATPADSKVTVSWTPSPGASSYQLKRGDSASGPWIAVGYPMVGNSFTVPGLENGRLYYFTVSAINGAGTSDNAPPVSATPQGETPPTPPAPFPVTDGLYVLVVYESAELAKYPPAQVNALYAASVRDWLRANTAKNAENSNGAWRIWDKDVDATAESKTWQAALAAAKSSKGFTTPWVILSNGKGGYSGPLPGNADDFLALLKKYAPAGTSTRRKAA